MIKKRKYFNAYMTLEVSLVFPIILTVLICIIYLIFYSYNRTIAFQNALIAAMYAKSYASTEEIDKDFDERIYMVLDTLNQNQYLAMEKIKQSVTVNGREIQIKQNGYMQIPLFNKDYISGMNFEETVILDVKNKIFYIRQVRKVENEYIRN